MREMAVVVLNYLNYSDTIECVDSILLQKQVPKKIVIVDNFSNNDSYNILSKRYCKNNLVTVILSLKNIGYARGNNLGIHYCKKVLNINNVLILNNDTVLKDENFILFFSNLTIDSDVAAVGPNIIGKDNLSQNPVYTNNTLKMMFRRIIYLCLSDRNIYKQIKKKKGLNNSKVKKNKMFILHGSAIFLTEHYLNKMHGLYPKTFLYVEENILDFIVKKMKMKMVYLDNVKIYHKEDRSSTEAFQNKEKIYKKIMLKSAFYAVFVYFLPIFFAKKTTIKQMEKDFISSIWRG